MDLLRLSRNLADRVRPLRFGAPVTHVYRPLDYARAPHEAYLRRYGGGRKRVLLLGMNPGPFGMAQTGVPFGDVDMVRDWLGICEPVQKPVPEHPHRPVLGFACPRSEVSGRRLWGWAKARFGTAQDFFQDFFVGNYCPLVFLEKTGTNRTPDKLPVSEQRLLLEACDTALAELVTALKPEFVIGVGSFAQSRATRALQGYPVIVGGILHPSPASPKANRGWAELAEGQLSELGVELPPSSGLNGLLGVRQGTSEGAYHGYKSHPHKPRQD